MTKTPITACRVFSRLTIAMEDQLLDSGAAPRQVALGCVRKEAEHGMGARQ